MSLKVRELFTLRAGSLRLRLATSENEAGLDRQIRDSEISSPGLALAGFTDRFTSGRAQVFGETEISYLRSLDAKQSRGALDTLFSFDVPCVFVTKGQELPRVLIDAAESANVPLIVSDLGTAEFYRRITPLLNEYFAPVTHVHGSLADVFGVGLLFVGGSGIGKSECVLDLVERGHRLVADDVVNIRRLGHDVLIGSGLELARYHMEIRGIGIIDIRGLFGVRAIRRQKRVEVIVQLVEWDDQEAYERTGLDHEHTSLLAVEVRRVTIPLNPGKNITVISEVIAMNHLLKYAGEDSAASFAERQLEAMLPAAEHPQDDYIREYLEEDYE